MGKTALCLIIMLFIAGVAASDALNEVPRAHWSYGAIDALMQRGLVHGYAAAPYGGPVPLTRAEMAGLVARAVRGVGEAMQERGRRLQSLAQTPPEGGAPGAAPKQECAPAPAVTPEDLARIEKLLAEFRNELVTMGARVDNIAAELARLQSQVAQTREQVAQVAAEAARHRISGYAQFRYTIDGSADVASEFAVRRARIALSGPVSPRVAYQLELDVPSQRQSDVSPVTLTQGYAAVNIGRATLLAGQFYVPFGWELFAPSRDLEAPEEAPGIGQLFVAQKYDRGLRLDANLGHQWQAWAAVINGSGFRRGDTNGRKDVVLRLARVHKPLEYGVSAYYGKDTQPATSMTPSYDANRHLVGAHVMAASGRAEFKGEVIAGRAAAPDAIFAGDRPVLAWTVLGGYVPRSDTRLAVRFHHFDPDRDQPDDAVNMTSLIWLRWLGDAVRLRLAEEFMQPQASGHYSIFTGELQVTY